MVLRRLPSLLTAAVALGACAGTAPAPTTAPPTVTVAAPAFAAATSEPDSAAVEPSLLDAGTTAADEPAGAGQRAEGPFAGIKPAGGSLSVATTPKLLVRSAVLVHRLGPDAGRALVLSDGLVSCATARLEDGTRKLEEPVEWTIGQRGQFTTMTLRSGFGTAYQGTYQVLVAPTAPNALGMVRIDPGPSGNVEGGVLTVPVCP